MAGNNTEKGCDVPIIGGLLQRLAEQAGQVPTGGEAPFGADRDAEDREQAERDAEQR